MLLVTSILSAAVVGCHRLPIGPHLPARVGVRPADRDPGSRRRGNWKPSSPISKNSLVIYTRGATATEADRGVHRRLRPTQRPRRSTRPNSSRSSTTTPTVRQGRDRRRPATPRRRRAAADVQRAAVPAGLLHRPFDRLRTSARSSSTTPATAARGRRPTPGSTTSSARSSTRFEFEDALLLDTRGQRRLQRLQGRRPRHQHPRPARTRAAICATPTRRRSTSNAVDYVGVTDFGDYQPADEPDRLDGVAGRAAGARRRRAGAAVPDLQDQPADDDGQAVAGVRAWARPARRSWSGPTI